MCTAIRPCVAKNTHGASHSRWVRGGQFFAPDTFWLEKQAHQLEDRIHQDASISGIWHWMDPLYPRTNVCTFLYVRRTQSETDLNTHSSTDLVKSISESGVSQMSRGLLPLGISRTFYGDAAQNSFQPEPGNWCVLLCHKFRSRAGLPRAYRSNHNVNSVSPRTETGKILTDLVDRCH